MVQQQTKPVVDKVDPVWGRICREAEEIVRREPDIAALFARFPLIAQYPTHWQHDLILPYEELPTYEGLRASGLESVLNYRGRPNVVGEVLDGPPTVPPGGMPARQPGAGAPGGAGLAIPGLQLTA